MATQRIQRVLASAGYGSRRACEQLVLDGRVAVNGEVSRTLPQLVDPARDRIAVNGRAIRSEAPVYYLLNKPRDVFCTNQDPAGRKRVVDLLKGVRERVFPVGRLDADSMGLLLLTNDGALTQKLTHPRFGVPKTYRAEVTGAPAAATIEKLRQGVWLSEGRTAPAQIRVVYRQRDRCILEITLREGRDREIRRILAKTGHNVRRLTRIATGKLSIKGLALGAFRRLTPQEVKYLYSLADKAAAQPLAGEGRSPRRGSRPGPSRGAGPERRATRGAPPVRAGVKRVRGRAVRSRRVLPPGSERS